MHFDLRAPGAVEAELARLEALGAIVERRDPSHTVMQDPEGNEFCVEPGPAPERGSRRLRPRGDAAAPQSARGGPARGHLHAASTRPGPDLHAAPLSWMTCSV